MVPTDGVVKVTRQRHLQATLHRLPGTSNQVPTDAIVLITRSPNHGTYSLAEVTRFSHPPPPPPYPTHPPTTTPPPPLSTPILLTSKWLKAAAPVEKTMAERLSAMRMRLVWDTSVFFILKLFFSCLRRKVMKVFKRSPTLWNMTMHSGIPEKA